MTSSWPCPCCGHLTLPDGPGAYELCPVCFWEDDPSQLRWPMSPDGANGVNLVEAQQAYQRTGTMHNTFRRKVRAPRAGEILDPGWRPFDPDVDWTHPELTGPRWPANREALYYWRPTYWNGDPHRLPAPPREQQAHLPRSRDQDTARPDLWVTSRGRPIHVIEDQLRSLDGVHGGGAHVDLHLALTARVLSDHRWGYRHPLAALALAWRYRRVQSPLRTLNWLRRPRFAG